MLQRKRTKLRCQPQLFALPRPTWSFGLRACSAGRAGSVGLRLRITQFSILRRLARLGPLSVTRLAAEAALDRSTMGRNLNPLERRGLVRIEAGNIDQRERVAYLTSAGEAAIEAALPYWRKAQERIAALAQPSAISELAHRLDVAGAREQIPCE